MTIGTVNCGEPSDQLTVKDGNVMDNAYNDRTFGATIQYTCNGDHIADKGPYRNCQLNGEWTDQPKCENVMCDGFALPSNGSFTASDKGKHVSFTCDSGFNLNGCKSITCGKMKQWSSDFPVCNIVNCVDPGYISNSERTGSSFTYTSQLTYSCNKGYELAGSSVIVCLSNGKWSDDPPVCSIKNCSSPDEVINGKRIGTVFTYNSEVVFECDLDFMLLGAKRIVCQSDGNWNASVPMCLPLSSSSSSSSSSSGSSPMNRSQSSSSFSSSFKSNSISTTSTNSMAVASLSAIHSISTTKTSLSNTFFRTMIRTMIRTIIPKLTDKPLSSVLETRSRPMSSDYSIGAVSTVLSSSQPPVVGRASSDGSIPVGGLAAIIVVLLIVLLAIITVVVIIILVLRFSHPFAASTRGDSLQYQGTDGKCTCMLL